MGATYQGMIWTGDKENGHGGEGLHRQIRITTIGNIRQSNNTGIDNTISYELKVSGDAHDI